MMTKLRVHMSALEDHHDLDVEVEVNGSQEQALLAVVCELPNHVWYRWFDLDTKENGRNQMVFPWEAEDWDETPSGKRYYESTLLPIEDDFGPAPLFKNAISRPRRVHV